MSATNEKAQFIVLYRVPLIQNKLRLLCQTQDKVYQNVISAGSRYNSRTKVLIVVLCPRAPIPLRFKVHKSVDV